VLEDEPAVVAVYPLHDHAFNRRWLRKWASKWRLTDADLTTVRDHYGEEIAFYFAFLNSYIAWLVPATAVGLAVYWMAGAYSMTHAVANIVWSTLFLVYWKRREREVRLQKLLLFEAVHAVINPPRSAASLLWHAQLSALWSTNNFSTTERVRAAFKGMPTTDPVTGEIVLVFPPCAPAHHDLIHRVVLLLTALCRTRGGC